MCSSGIHHGVSSVVQPARPTLRTLKCSFRTANNMTAIDLERLINHDKNVIKRTFSTYTGALFGVCQKMLVPLWAHLATKRAGCPRRRETVNITI